MGRILSFTGCPGSYLLDWHNCQLFYLRKFNIKYANQELVFKNDEIVKKQKWNIKTVVIKAWSIDP